MTTRSWEALDLAPIVDLPADPLVSGRRSPVSEHIRAGLDARLRALIAHDPGTRLGEDPEELHQMRVAVRRMRAMLRSGRSFLDQSWSEPLRAELGWLGRALGPVRDLDVLLDRLRQESADFTEDEQAAVARLISGLETERREARRELLATLDSYRYVELVRSLAEAVRTGPLTTQSDMDGESVLHRLVTKQFRTMRKAVLRLADDAADEELHALRIRGKRLRYTAELAEPASGKGMRPLIKATRSFQDVLGEHQDACVARDRVRGLLRDLDDESDMRVAFVAGRLVERETVRRAEHRAHWRRCWDKLEAAAEIL